mgnify:FL=1
MQTEIVSLPNVLPYVVIGTIGFVLAIILTVWVRRTLRRWRFGADRESVTKHWQAVEDLAARGDAMSYRLAIIQADAVLDLALKAKAFPGTTTGERLKFASRKYRDLRRAFWARSLRNRLVHEAGSDLKIGDAKRAIADFREALVELGAL